MPVLSLLWCQLSVDRIRGPRIIAVAGNRGHLWGEQHRIETRTKRNHSRVNSEYLTLGGNYSRSPLINADEVLGAHAGLPPPGPGFFDFYCSVRIRERRVSNFAHPRAVTARLDRSEPHAEHCTSARGLHHFSGACSPSANSPVPLFEV